MKLEPMKKYNIDNLRYLGWMDNGDVLDDNPPGYNAYYYFRDGLYLGPDEYGIEPYFEVIDIKSAAAALGKLGGLKKSPKKTDAARINGRRPKRLTAKQQLVKLLTGKVKMPQRATYERLMTIAAENKIIVYEPGAYDGMDQVVIVDGMLTYAVVDGKVEVIKRG